MTTSFDTPRVLGHHNPFASFEDTTDDPLASGSGGGGGSGFPSYTSTSHGINSNTSTSTDPWSNSYYVPVGEASTSSSTSNNNAQLNGILDEDSIPVIYIQAWNAASSSSSNSSTSFGSTFNTTGNTISLTILQKVLSNCAALSAGDTEKIINLVSGSSGNLSSSYTASGGGDGNLDATFSPTSPFKLYGGNTSSNIGNSSHNGNGRISKLEFYVALALAALAQQKEALSIQSVLSRKNNLPIPTLDLSSLQRQQGSTITRRPSNTRQPSSPTQNTPYRSHKISTGSTISDPWKNNNGSSISQTPKHHNRISAAAAAENLYNKDDEDQNNDIPPSMYSPTRKARITENGYSSFPSFDEEENYINDSHGTLEKGRGNSSSSSSSPPSSDSALLSLPPFHSSIQLSREFKKIIVLQEEELKGNFLNRYTCYKIISQFHHHHHQEGNNDDDGGNNTIEVHRRYSDWVILNDYLELKYESRVKLSLPPKRMGISSRHVHIGSDVQFLERRRRSLNRYIEFISNHPIINKDKVVIAFLTEINIEFSIWKKMNSTVFQIDSQKNDEASLIGKLSNSQENIINNTANNDNSFENIIKILKEELPLLIESINRFCSLIERIFFRNLQNENDFIRFKLAFDSFGEIYSDLSSNNNNSSSSSRQHQSDSNSTTTTVGKNSGRPKEIEEETILLQRELNKFSNGIGNIIELNERSNNERIEILENQFKLQRDLWRSLLFLINKYESKFKFDNVDKIKKRIESNQSRYSILNNNTNNENGSNINNNNSNNKRQQKEEEEKRKIINNIEIDQNEIERLMNRRIFYKWSLMCEIRLIWRYSTLMRVYISDLIIRENKHYKHISRVWEDLEERLAFTDC